MLSIINRLSSQDFVMLVAVNGREKEIDLRVSGRGFDGDEWVVGKVNGEKVTDLAYLSLNALQGLEVLPAKATNAMINLEGILKYLELQTDSQLPGEFNTEATGSILLAVAVQASSKAKEQKDGLKVNRKVTRQPLTPDDWVNAYKVVEGKAYLPIYLRDQFVAAMKAIGVSISFGAVKVKESNSVKRNRKAKDPATVPATVPDSYTMISTPQNGKDPVMVQASV